MQQYELAFARESLTVAGGRRYSGKADGLYRALEWSPPVGSRKRCQRPLCDVGSEFPLALESNPSPRRLADLGDWRMRGVRTPRATNRRGEKTSDEIRSVAIDLFYKRGFQATTLRDIAA